MSASLVGSEMCIRDRKKEETGEGEEEDARAELAASPAPYPSDPGAKAAPVSYTHLTLPTICSV
eukprot:1751931-Alexandrium_andersonii.AAC.1